MKETEIVIYAKIGNEEGLKQAFKTIDQEQAQVHAPNGRIRVSMERDTSIKNDWVYTLTTKHKVNNVTGIASNKETTKLIDDEIYSMFKSVADVFQRKTRYVFKVENVKVQTSNMSGQIYVEELFFEVDRFYTEKPDGTIEFSEWVKIDIEIDNLIAALKEDSYPDSLNMEIKVALSQLPFAPTSAFMEEPDNPKTKELIGAIFDNLFNRKIKQIATERHHGVQTSFKKNITKAFVDALS